MYSSNPCYCTGDTPSLFPNIQCIPNVQRCPDRPSHPSPSTAMRPRERPAPAPAFRGGSCPRGRTRAQAPQAQGPPQAGWTREAQGWGSHGSSPLRDGVAGMVQVVTVTGLAVDVLSAAVAVPAVGPFALVAAAPVVPACSFAVVAVAPVVPACPSGGVSAAQSPPQCGCTSPAQGSSSGGAGASSRVGPAGESRRRRLVAGCRVHVAVTAPSLLSLAPRPQSPPPQPIRLAPQLGQTSGSSSLSSDISSSSRSSQSSSDQPLPPQSSELQFIGLLARFRLKLSLAALRPAILA